MQDNCVMSFSMLQFISLSFFPPSDVLCFFKLISSSSIHFCSSRSVSLKEKKSFPPPNKNVSHYLRAFFNIYIFNDWVSGIFFYKVLCNNTFFCYCRIFHGCQSPFCVFWIELFRYPENMTLCFVEDFCLITITCVHPLILFLFQGVTDPMLYIGMLFSMFAWHVEDHYLYRYMFICYFRVLVVQYLCFVC